MLDLLKIFIWSGYDSARQLFLCKYLFNELKFGVVMNKSPFLLNFLLRAVRIVLGSGTCSITSITVITSKVSGWERIDSRLLMGIPR